jgi:hypothetical protein
MAEYRRKRGSDTWHWCRNCTNDPKTDYDTKSTRPDYDLWSERGSRQFGHKAPQMRHFCPAINMLSGLHSLGNCASEPQLTGAGDRFLDPFSKLPLFPLGPLWL